MKKTYLDLSTGHLSRDTLNMLDAAVFHSRVAPDWPAMSIGQYPAGYFITVPNVDLPDVAEQLHKVPQDLRCCLLLAFSEGAELIRFDADGYIHVTLLCRQEI